MTLRHGDINITPAESIGEGFIKRTNGVNALAYGEVTGHSHRILPKTKESQVEIYENDKGELAIRVNGIAVLVHEEHKTLEIPTGVYKINREREFDYFQMSTRRVID